MKYLLIEVGLHCNALHCIMSNFIDQLVLQTDQEMGKSDQLVGDTLSGQGGGELWHYLNWDWDWGSIALLD